MALYLIQALHDTTNINKCEKLNKKYKKIKIVTTLPFLVNDGNLEDFPTSKDGF